MAKKKAGALSFEIATTAAIVQCSNFLFADANGNDDSENIACDIQVQFNGFAPAQGDRVSFSRNATTTQKQAAVRNKVNALLAPYEPTVGNLNNNNIQITGLPV